MISKRWNDKGACRCGRLEQTEKKLSSPNLTRHYLKSTFTQHTSLKYHPIFWKWSLNKHPCPCRRLEQTEKKLSSTNLTRHFLKSTFTQQTSLKYHPIFWKWSLNKHPCPCGRLEQTEKKLSSANLTRHFLKSTFFSILAWNVIQWFQNDEMIKVHVLVDVGRKPKKSCLHLT